MGSETKYDRGSIASIIGDGYDLGCSTDEIGAAVFDHINGAPNPYEADADAMHAEQRTARDLTVPADARLAPHLAAPREEDTQSDG